MSEEQQDIDLTGCTCPIQLRTFGTHMVGCPVLDREDEALIQTGLFEWVEDA